MEAVQAADELAAEDAAVAVELQPDWGSQGGDEQDEQTSNDVPAWGVESDDEEEQAVENAAPLWTVPETTETPQEQPIQLWGDQPSSNTTQDPNWNGQQSTGQDQGWNGQQSGGQEQAGGGQQVGPQGGQPAAPQGGQLWGSQQGTAAGEASADNGWGAAGQHGVQESGQWGQQPADSQQSSNQLWGGQSWPVQEAKQQGGNGWGDSQQAAQQPAHQGWQGGQWGAQHGAQQTTPRAWGEDEAWGAQTDLSAGVGKREPGKKKSKGSGGGSPFGGKLPLIVGGGVALVLLVVTAIVLLTNGDDTTADPGPSPTQTASPTPTNQSSIKPGQSKNPKLHEGIERISSDAISFPRRNPPWSDHKLFVPETRNAGGQRILLQRDAAGTRDDWSADIFVGGLGTGSGFNGDPKATAATVSTQLQRTMYGDIPVTFKTIANGAVKRSEKAGWFYQQTVTAKSAAVPNRVLTLTVAVFDLGDGTAVAYVSSIPNDRPDLKTAAAEAFKGIQVG
ncbi:hypothetical protein [Kribbella sp. HUAS MG21]|uniref:Uncharacterized protein n=1 Tax=Kribbella sp. HUAS MG21 TaxID=3160966 RepID=A0AAU7TCB8_9ACTN